MFMSKCCKTAAAYGDMPLSVDKKPKKVTVILNPAANKRYLSNFFYLNKIILYFLMVYLGMPNQILKNIVLHYCT